MLHVAPETVSQPRAIQITASTQIKLIYLIKKKDLTSGHRVQESQNFVRNLVRLLLNILFEHGVIGGISFGFV